MNRLYKVDVYATKDSRHGTTYFIPTSKKYNNLTYCYIFEGNNFNWVLEYKYGIFMDLDRHFYQYIPDVYVTEDNLEGVMCWEEIKKNFRKLLDKEW